jgi:tetratricopeptide (TPR) repeat protein
MTDTFDLFLSYARAADGAAADRVARALGAAGLRVWRDLSEVREFHGISDEVAQGIAGSRAFLALYSAAYPRRPVCQWELQQAYLAAQRAGDPLRRILAVNLEPGFAHVHPVQLRDAQLPQLPAPGDDAALAALARAVADRIADVQGTLGGAAPPEGAVWRGAAQFRASTFVGRFAELWGIHSALHGDTAPVSTGGRGRGIAVVHGMAGVGKTQLAAEYAHRFAAAFPGGVFWLRAAAPEDGGPAAPADGDAVLLDQLAGIAEQAGARVEGTGIDAHRRAIADVIRQAGVGCLWVVDDLPAGMDPGDVARWLAPHPLARTLIVTESSEYAELGTPVDVGILDAEAGLELLTARRAPEGDAEHAAARGIVADLGGHALALALTGAAAAAGVGLTSYSELRRELADRGQDELEAFRPLAGALPTGAGTSIARVLLRSVALLGDEGRDFLRLAAALAAAPIPATMVADVFGRADSLDETQARRRATLALAQAERLSLAERDADGAARVHALVSRTMRFRDATPERRAALRAAAIDALNRVLLAVADVRRHGGVVAPLAHARELARDAASVEEARLLGRDARYERERDALVAALPLYRRQWEVWLRLLGPEHTDTLASQSNYAGLLGTVGGDPVQALRLLEEAVRTSTRVFGPRHGDTLAILHQLAWTLQENGRLDEARAVYEELLPLSEAVMGAESEQTLTVWNNLAVGYAERNDLETAERMLRRMVETAIRSLGRSHPRTLRAVESLAEIVERRGDTRGAAALLDQVYMRSLQVLGPRHPRVVQAAVRLGHTLLRLNEPVMAEALMNDLAWLPRAEPDTLDDGLHALQDEVRELAMAIVLWRPPPDDAPAAPPSA